MKKLFWFKKRHMHTKHTNKYIILYNNEYDTENFTSQPLCVVDTLTEANQIVKHLELQFGQWNQFLTSKFEEFRTSYAQRYPAPVRPNKPTGADLDDELWYVKYRKATKEYEEISAQYSLESWQAEKEFIQNNWTWHLGLSTEATEKLTEDVDFAHYPNEMRFHYQLISHTTIA